MSDCQQSQESPVALQRDLDAAMQDLGAQLAEVMQTLAVLETTQVDLATELRAKVERLQTDINTFRCGLRSIYDRLERLESIARQLQKLPPLVIVATG